MTRVDPFRGFRFLVEIDGITSGGFARVKGLSREVKFESYREGGMNEYEHKLVSSVVFPALVLERGLAADDLWNWAQSAAEATDRARRSPVSCVRFASPHSRVWPRSGFA